MSIDDNKRLQRKSIFVQSAFYVQKEHKQEGEFIGEIIDFAEYVDYIINRDSNTTKTITEGF